MKKLLKKLTLVTLVGATTFMMSGCYGSFSLTRKLHGWNGEISDSKIVRELVFLGLTIIPVYELCAMGDALIFNSIEFWGGSNPIAMEDGKTEEMEMMHEGNKYKVIKSKNAMSVAMVEGALQVDFKYFPKEKAWYQMDGDQKIKVADLKGDKVFTYLPNNKTLVFDNQSVDFVESEVLANRD